MRPAAPIFLSHSISAIFADTASQLKSKLGIMSELLSGFQLLMQKQDSSELKKLCLLKEFGIPFRALTLRGAYCLYYRGTFL